MRLVPACLIIALFPMFLTLAPGQLNDASELKHVFIAPQNAGRSVGMEARSIERGLPYPSVVTLKGNVLIKTPVCLAAVQNSGPVCDGYMTVRADEAQFDEATGEIRPHGNVVVTPVWHDK